MPEVLEPTSWGAGATAAPNDMVVIVDRGSDFFVIAFQVSRRKEEKIEEQAT